MSRQWTIQKAKRGKVTFYQVEEPASGGWSDVVASVNDEADARLIAAAPDLLESVNELLGCMSLAGWEGDPIAEKARAAITKAAQP